LFPVSRRGGNIPVETMSEPDNSLIAEFNARRSEDAFAALVRQHVNLVFATALRQVGDAGTAEEITQNVFVALAQAAGKLGSHPTIAGWLHHTALNKSREWLRGELRRRKREQVAVNLDLARAEGDSVWSPLVPLLDEALLELREPDRQAVILHFMEGRTFQEVGSALGMGEDAARKRVDRCLGQLSHFFRRHGFATPALAVGAPLFVLSSHAAPAGLAASATTAGLAAAHSAASTSTLTFIKGALKIMTWSKVKTAVVVGVGILLAAETTTVTVKKIEASRDNAVFEQIWSQPDSRSMDTLVHAPPALIVRPTRYPARSQGYWTDSRVDHGMWVNASISELVGFAYHFPSYRAVFPADMPGGRFDLMETLPAGQNDAALKKEIQKRFGLVVHTETREADTLRLVVNDPARLSSHVSAGGQSSTYGAGGDNNTMNYVFKNRTLKDVASGLEGYFDQPVVEPNGLTDHYDFTFQVNYKLQREDLRQSFRDQLAQFGLQLVPGSAPIEMLVVEKVK